MSRKYTLLCLVENHFGVLARISALISARGFNIDSLTVSATEDPTASRMTIVVDADTPAKLEQVKNQLSRLIDVIEVQELKEGEFIDREILLAHIEADDAAQAKLKELLSRYGGRISDSKNHSVVVEATGHTKKLDELVEQLRGYGITKLVRTGRVAIEKP